MTDFDPKSVALPRGHFIAGQLREEGTDSLPVHRPSDGAVYATLPAGTPELVDEAVGAAKSAFRGSDWARGAPRERARILRRLAEAIEADIDTLAPLEALGSTRPIAEARGWDIPTAAETFRFFGEFADKVGGQVAATRQDHLGMTITEPYGVVAAIAPWNFPLVMACWKLGAALAAGNAVVLKPSELTPFSVVRLAQLAVAAGVPPGIFNVVQGSGAVVGEALCRHPGVGKITFTGSTRTGVAIMKAAAETGVKPVTLELGGKSPQLVFADADTELASRAIARSITGNAGQVCVAGSRLIVARSLHDEMVERLSRLMTAVTPGPTWQARTTFSPIISLGQLDRVDGLVKSTVRQGAEAVLGGNRMTAPQEGIFYEPTILAGCDSSMDAVREEVFGPVLTVQGFEDEEEGIALADHPEYGLAAGIYSRDLARALRAMRTIEAGTVWINRYGRSADFVLPTGGYKRSGIGKDLGREAFEGNLKVKSVLVDLGA
jgi:aldehyde dehydrogenase (NAD+)